MERPRSIGHELRQLGILLKRQIDAAPVMARFQDITGLHRFVIKFIIDAGERDVFQKDIETHFNIRRSTATNILQLMEKNGYLTREAMAHDGRLKRLVLTDRAHELHDVIMLEIHTLEQKLQQGLSPEELATFFTLVDKMKHNIEA